jgi:hypothetical protein
MRRWPAGLFLRLLLVGLAEIALLVAVWRFFGRTWQGQLLDTVALEGNSVGRARVEQVVDTILNAISLVSLVIATGVVTFIALIRRRVALAFGITVLIGGANLTAQLLKHFLVRPELGVDPERAGAGNSLPSGHTTIAASVTIALILVLPGRVRVAGALVGAGLTTAAGVATMSAGWHRPSDAVAAVLVAGAWAGVASMLIVFAQARHGEADYGRPHRAACLVLGLTGLALLVGTVIAAGSTWQQLHTSTPEDLDRDPLLVGYAGGALGIAGVVCLVFAAVLLTVHRVAPRAVAARDPDQSPTRHVVPELK